MIQFFLTIFLPLILPWFYKLTFGVNGTSGWTASIVVSGCMVVANIGLLIWDRSHWMEDGKPTLRLLLYTIFQFAGLTMGVQNTPAEITGYTAIAQIAWYAYALGTVGIFGWWLWKHFLYTYAPHTSIAAGTGMLLGLFNSTVALFLGIGTSMFVYVFFALALILWPIVYFFKIQTKH